MFRRRRFGELIVYEIPSCDRCEQSSCSIKCIDCTRNLCYSCAHEIHCKGSWKLHQLGVISYGVGEESSNTLTFDSSSSDSTVSSSFIDEGNFDAESQTDVNLDGKNKQTIFDAISCGNLILFVEIEDYEELNCARMITSHFDNNNNVQAALNRIASKQNVCINIGGEKNREYDLFFVDINGDYILMEKSRLLSEYRLSYKQTIKLRSRNSPWKPPPISAKEEPIIKKRKSWLTLKKSSKSKEKTKSHSLPNSNGSSSKSYFKFKTLSKSGRPNSNSTSKSSNDHNSYNTNTYENKIVLTIEIEDYEVLNCVRKFSDFFDINATILEAIFQIAKKNSVCLDLSNDRDNYFQLYLSSTQKSIRLDKTRRLSQCGLTHRDTVVLKMTDD